MTGTKEMCSTAAVSGAQDPWVGDWRQGVAGVYDLVLLVRFLPREFLPVLSKILAPGGVVVLHHFDEGALEWGRPTKRSHVLGRGEGKRLLEDAGLTVGWRVCWGVGPSCTLDFVLKVLLISQLRFRFTFSLPCVSWSAF